MSENVRPVCRHCGERVVTRPLGLCWRCYYSPARGDYYSKSPSSNRGIRDHYGTRPATECTDALPGTEEKMVAMAERARKGEALFHPRDARYTYVRPPSVACADCRRQIRATAAEDGRCANCALDAERRERQASGA